MKYIKTCGKDFLILLPSKIAIETTKRVKIDFLKILQKQQFWLKNTIIYIAHFIIPDRNPVHGYTEIR